MATTNNARNEDGRLASVNRGGNIRDLFRIYLIGLLIAAALAGSAYLYASRGGAL